jgi:short-subunit dehydrogenase
MSTNGSGTKKTALITGASSGIGLELARLFAQDGYDLVLVARSESKLTALGDELKEKHGVKTSVIALDLAKPESPAEVVKALEAKGLDVDVLVNNAGYGLFGPFAETKLETELDMIQVNIVALTELTKRILPKMLARRTGKILNLASTAAFQPGPLMAVYYATKAYVLSFSEALSRELRDTGITVTALCPGPTKSGFQAASKLEASKLVSGKKLPDAESVARAGYRALMRGQPVAIVGFTNWMLAESIRFTPRSVVRALVYKLQERRTDAN